jgi:hypothetical protein
MDNVETNGAAQPGAPQVSKDVFDGQELVVAGETAAAAVAAQAKASVEARYIVAMRRPRDLDDVRVRLLKECKRPSLAKVAIYSKPVGNERLQGLSIRFVEMALRCMGNIVADTMTVFDGKDRRIVRVTITDLESNVTYPKDITIEKTVERKSLSDGRVPLSSRRNSSGKTTYLVPATEDEMLNKENSLVSKAIRTSGLRLIPGDLQDEALDVIRKTMSNRDAEDPDTARRELADAFANMNVMPSALADYLGHDLGLTSPAELQDLRQVYAAIRDGEATWSELLAAKLGKPEDEGPAAPDPKAQELKGKLQAARDGDKAKPAGAAPAAASTSSAAAASEETGEVITPQQIAKINGLIEEIDKLKDGEGLAALHAAAGTVDLDALTQKQAGEAEKFLTARLAQLKKPAGGKATGAAQGDLV